VWSLSPTTLPTSSSGSRSSMRSRYISICLGLATGLARESPKSALFPSEKYFETAPITSPDPALITALPFVSTPFPKSD
jgi:hypothetical protein